MTRTFQRYTWGEYDANNDDGLAVSGVEWDGYSCSGAADWDAVLAEAAWQECGETAIGSLIRDWNGHPEGALIVSDDTRPGLDFAVSTETDAQRRESVTPADVAELLRSTSMDPTLVRWLDTGEVEVVAGVLFSDISYSGRNREHEVIATAADLRSSGDWDIENPTQDDYEAFAQQLNES